MPLIGPLPRYADWPALALNEAPECPKKEATARIKINKLLEAQIKERIETLRTSATDDTGKRMAAEAQELRARKVLAKHEQTVLDAIERKKKHAAYRLCIDNTTTNAITKKSTAVTKAAVSQRLKQGFRRELETLAFHHVEVELTEAGGAGGVLYHKLILTRAPGVELPRVVGEGEQRCLSIAAFFAELSTADDHSGIVFDDPISSLDYRWREGVARRLVQEADTRHAGPHRAVPAVIPSAVARDREGRSIVAACSEPLDPRAMDWSGHAGGYYCGPSGSIPCG